MILDNYCDSILTIGCNHIPPTGGVAQVLYIYDKYVFARFSKLTDTRGGGVINKFTQFFFATVRLIMKLLFDNNIKVVHIHTSSYNSFKRSSVFVILSKIFGRRVILHMHGGSFNEFYRTSPRRITNILNKCDTIIALSEYWRSYFLEIVDGPKVFVVNNPVEPPVFENIKSDGKIHFLFLGLMTKDKGIYDLLDVLEDNKHEYMDKIVVHLGGNGEVDNVLRRINEDGIQEIVKYEGWVSGVDKIRLMNLSSVFILPSYAEGQPVSILEAMSYGLYIISTDVGGIPEVVKGDVGVLFHPGNKSALKAAIDNCILYPLGSKERFFISEKAKDYSPDAVKKKLNEIYSNYL